jgi:hypothetical protein
MEALNHHSPTTSFYFKINNDERILTSHVSLFMAIHESWRQKKYEYPIPITRKDLMAKAKIRSIVTYHKCISNLHQWGYLRYIPSNHPCGSKVHWMTGDFAITA